MADIPHADSSHHDGNHHDHPHHDVQIPKLNRVGGQIDGIKRMIEDGRGCTDILTQLRAARAAIRRVEADILETHLKHCVTEAMMAGDTAQAQAKIEEIRALFKRYED